MSGPRILDFTPTPNPVQENLEKFFTNLGKDYRDKQDRVEIGNIISQYDQSKRQLNDYQNALSALDKSTISPTKRLELANSFKARQEASLENMKALNNKTNLMQQQAKVDAAAKEKIDKTNAASEIKRAKEQKAEEDARLKSEKTEIEVYELAKLAGKSDEEANHLSKRISVDTAKSLLTNEFAKDKVKSKEEIKQEEAEKEMSVAQDSFNNLVDLTENAGWAVKASQYWNKKDARTVGEFTSTLGSLESILKDRVSKGTLSNARFNYIKNDLLPKVDDLQDVIIGKLKGLGKVLKFDTSELDRKYPEIGAAKTSEDKKQAPAGMIRVRLKSDPTKTGSVTPYPGWEKKYDAE